MDHKPVVVEPAWGTPEWHRLHPIYLKPEDFQKTPDKLVNDIRWDIVNLRGQLSDISKAYPGWKGQLEAVEGLLTCGLISLYDTMKQMEQVSKENK
jgi:hypothetical protein